MPELWGKWMQGWWYLGFVTAAFAVAGLRPDFIADLADLYAALPLQFEGR